MSKQYSQEDVERVLRDMHVSVYDFNDRMTRLQRQALSASAHQSEDAEMERKGYVRDFYGHWRPGR